MEKEEIWVACKGREKGSSGGSPDHHRKEEHKISPLNTFGHIKGSEFVYKFVYVCVHICTYMSE